MSDLQDKKVAVLVDNYVEEPELTEPIDALKAAGITVELIASGSEDGQIQAMQHADKSNMYKIDKTLDEASINDYDALLLPGGGINSDSLRMQTKAQEWVKAMTEMNKPIAAICHAPWLLSSAGVVSGRKLTSYYTIQDDMRAAGAEWVDQEVVVDGNLITSRKPDDIPAFNKAFMDALAIA